MEDKNDLRRSKNLIDDITWKYNGNSITNEMICECRDKCREALDKQIPHKLKPNNSQSKGGCIPVCGKCNGIMDLEQGDLNYCPNCGQAIDWSDEG